MKTLKTEVTYIESASRLEVPVRVLYYIALSIISGFLTPIGGLLAVIQALHVLATGKRNLALHRWLRLIVMYGSRANYYAFMLIDERPPLVPDFE
ncbi:MAG: DUF4389 domain-containing protein [Candidatus Micrarchaeia archaeon]